MSAFTLTDAVIWADAADLTGVSNKVTLKYTIADKDAAVFGASGGYRVRLGSLADVEIAASGFLDVNSSPSTSQDALTFAAQGIVNKSFTIAPASITGSTAYMVQAVPLAYGLLGAAPGEMAPYDLSAKGSGTVGLGRGQIATPKQTISSFGPTVPVTGVTIPAGTKKLWAVVHCFTAGTTMTVQVQSAPSNTFAAPTVQATLPAITAVGAVTFVPFLVTTTDTWWRFNVSAVTGTFVIAGAIAFQ